MLAVFNNSLTGPTRNDIMKAVKVDKKWYVEGDATGWIVEKRFPAKWKAELAIRIYQLGGKYSDYMKQVGLEKENRPKRKPVKAIKELEQALSIINSLDPTCDEIIEYGKSEHYGAASFNERNGGYWKPQLHNTWGEKRGGRVHIDIGCGGWHLMLDRYWAPDFIAWIREKRQQ